MSGAVAYSTFDPIDAAPGISYSPLGKRWVTAAAPVTYTVTVQNNGSASSTFDVHAAVPAGWSAATVRTPVIAPGGNATVTLSVTPAAAAMQADYTVTLGAANTSDSTQSATTPALVAIVTSLRVTMSPDKASYLRATDTTASARVTTRVTSRATGFPGAAVVVALRDPLGMTTTYPGTTDADGYVLTDVPLTGASLLGTYSASASATLGSVTGAAVTSFLVTRK